MCARAASTEAVSPPSVFLPFSYKISSSSPKFSFSSNFYKTVRFSGCLFSPLKFHYTNGRKHIRLSGKFLFILANRDKTKPFKLSNIFKNQKRIYGGKASRILDHKLLEQNCIYYKKNVALQNISLF